MPIIRAGLLTAGLLVFVDVMKELPATLIMRPFDFNTWRCAPMSWRRTNCSRSPQAHRWRSWQSGSSRSLC